MLTCYSALLYLLALHNMADTIGPEDIRKMAAKSPTERLEWLLTLGDFKEAHRLLVDLLQRYTDFLNNTNANESILVDRISDKDTRRSYFDQANAFGDVVFELIEVVGQRSRLHRLLVV
jgi:hypothetical protein